MSQVGWVSCALGLVAVVAGVVIAPAGAAPTRVTICHSLHEGGPWVSITVDVSALGPPGHSNHPYDIIPPVPNVHPGQNWDAAGQAIHGNGCVVPPPTTTTTTEATTTTTEATTTTTEATTTTSSTVAAPCQYNAALRADDPACRPAVAVVERLPITGAGSSLKLFAVGLLLIVVGAQCMVLGDGQRLSRLRSADPW